jgi:hypothetical protein
VRARLVIVAACVVPRAVVLVHERRAILSAYVEGSDYLARIFVKSGTFGFVPGEPSAYIQPLYGFFLIPIYWVAGRHWWSIGTAEIAVAVGTALLVYEIGRRYLSPRAGLAAALIATLEPYLVWHDVHVNREILDQPLGAAMFLLALMVARRPSWRLAAALGLVSGVAILSNSRLLLFPVALGGFLVWRHAGWGTAALVPALAVVALAPWVVRNKVEVGCFAITTDAKALWKANNPTTYATLAGGLWIDDVPGAGNGTDTPFGAGDIYASTGRKIHVDECGNQAHYEHLVVRFWEHHPGEKVRLMAQATRMLWSPTVQADTSGASSTGGLSAIRRLVQPAYTIALYALAVAGLFFVSAAFRVLALAFLGYETLAAWVFAGTTRYRVAWDFVLALLAAAALDRILARRRRAVAAP